MLSVIVNLATRRFLSIESWPILKLWIEYRRADEGEHAHAPATCMFIKVDEISDKLCSYLPISSLKMSVSKREQEVVVTNYFHWHSLLY